jgi:hypothetical protein
VLAWTEISRRLERAAPKHLDSSLPRVTYVALCKEELVYTRES